MLATGIPIIAIALLLLVAFSPGAAYRVAATLEAVARELRNHGGAMAGAYAAYNGIRRALSNPGARIQTASARREINAGGMI